VKLSLAIDIVAFDSNVRDHKQFHGVVPDIERKGPVDSFKSSSLPSLPCDLRWEQQSIYTLLRLRTKRSRNLYFWTTSLTQVYIHTYIESTYFRNLLSSSTGGLSPAKDTSGQMRRGQHEDKGMAGSALLYS